MPRAVFAVSPHRPDLIHARKSACYHSFEREFWGGSEPSGACPYGVQVLLDRGSWDEGWGRHLEKAATVEPGSDRREHERPGAQTFRIDPGGQDVGAGAISAFASSHHLLPHALDVLLRASVDLDPGAFLDEQGHVDRGTGGQGRRLDTALCGVALHAGLTIGDLELDEVW